MTKMMMVEVVKEMEKEAWDDLHRYEKVLGKTNDITNRARTRWAALDDVLRNLEIR